ncbi:hypothetical protein ALC60_11078, partial [Trachymyrmex zeteki]
VVCAPAATYTSLKKKRNAHKGVVPRLYFRVVHSGVLLVTAANRRLSCPAIRTTSWAAFK